MNTNVTVCSVTSDGLVSQRPASVVLQQTKLQKNRNTARAMRKCLEVYFNVDMLEDSEL